MQSITRDIIEATLEASNLGRIHFGQVIAALSSAGVESYHVDYRAGRSTYYLPDGETVELAFEAAARVTATFQAEAIRSAIRGAQQGKLMYPEFKRLSEQAGCIGYIVWITGRCQATSGTDPRATFRVDPGLLINRFELRCSRWPGEPGQRGVSFAGGSCRRGS